MLLHYFYTLHVAEGKWTHTLVEAASPQVVRNDDIRHGIEHKLNVICICGTRHVAINLLGRGLVLSLELCLDVGGRLPVLLSACQDSDGD